MALTEREFIMSLTEEHLDEIASLYLQRRHFLLYSTDQWGDLAYMEEWLTSHGEAMTPMGETGAEQALLTMNAQGKLRFPQLVPFLGRLACDADPDVMETGMLNLFLRGNAETLPLLRSICKEPTRKGSLRCLLLAVCGRKSDAAVLARHLSELLAVLALGMLGAPASIPALIELLNDEQNEIRTAAAEALHLMTGVTFEKSFEKLEQEREQELKNEDEEGELREPRRNLCMDAWTWRRWWAENGSRMPSDGRIRLGRPLFALGTCAQRLWNASLSVYVRQWGCRELIIRSRTNVSFEADWLEKEQRAALEGLNEEPKMKVRRGPAVCRCVKHRCGSNFRRKRINLYFIVSYLGLAVSDSAARYGNRAGCPPR